MCHVFGSEIDCLGKSVWTLEYWYFVRLDTSGVQTYMGTWVPVYWPRFQIPGPELDVDVITSFLMWI